MWTKNDLKFMCQALRLAKSAEGRTTPDPLVGAVLVKNGKIIAQGYHGEVTTPHAEAWAIQKAGRKAKGSTLYLNLEPCCFFETKNNPPCTEAIIKAGIKKVIAALQDPNPAVAGRGFAKLKKHGIKVRVGLLKEEAERLNEVFIKYITTKKPFVVLKTAMTIDGKIATRTGASRWVASLASRKYGHHLRNIYDAILVGVRTVLIDNPKLTVRLVKKIKNPIRIVLDAFARTPRKANVLNTRETRTIIVVGPTAPQKRISSLEKKGVEILKVKAPQGLIDLKELIKKLGEMQITSILIEGGGEVAASALEAKVVDKLLFFVAPKIFGGKEAKTPVEGEGIKFPSQALSLKNVTLEKIGEDFLVTAYLQKY